MTVVFLLEALVKELENLFDGFFLKDSDGEQSNINIYLQNLPSPSIEQYKGFAPFIIVRYKSLTDSAPDECATANISFIICAVDKDNNYQGYKDAINIQEKIRQHLILKSIIDNRFMINYPVKCSPFGEFSDETYPHFFGEVETIWKIPNISRKEDLR